MANTFKVVTKAGVTSADVIYTAGGSVISTIILGLILGNTTTGQVTATVTLGTNTGSRAGNKVVLETTDTLSVTASGATDVALSIMEIT